MSDIKISVGPATDAARFLATDETVWFAEVMSASVEEQLIGISSDQRFAARTDRDHEVDAATYPGIYGVFPLSLTVPGPGGGLRQTPCAGLTWVGVHPDHRRQGILTAMLRHHFEQVRATPDTHISALHASEPAIYGRHGYGLASLELEVSLSRGAKLTAAGLEESAAAVTTRIAQITDPDVPGRLRTCHLGAADLGSVVGEVGYYERVCLQLPEELRGKEPWRILLAQRDGLDVGFAMFRRHEKWEHARPDATLEAWAVVGDPGARLALLRRLVDFDLVSTVKVGTVGATDPLLLWAGGPRATSGIETYDSLWLRIVDLPEALMARAWSAPCDVVLDVVDRAAPWNEGRWRVHAASDGSALVEPTAADADLRLPVEALGSAYLGGASLFDMARAGLVTEQRPGAARELWHAMRSDVTPTAAVGF